VSTGEADQNAQLQALQAEFGTLDFFCINDTTDDAHTHDPRLQNVLAVLQGMLPVPSGFENEPFTGVPSALQAPLGGRLQQGHALDAPSASEVQKRA
jgi:hypothetical protein